MVCPEHPYFEIESVDSTIFCLLQRQCLDHTSSGIISEYLLVLMDQTLLSELDRYYLQKSTLIVAFHRKCFWQFD